jgi:hypothetical protein
MVFYIAGIIKYRYVDNFCKKFIHVQLQRLAHRVASIQMLKSKNDFISWPRERLSGLTKALALLFFCMKAAAAKT